MSLESLELELRQGPEVTTPPPPITHAAAEAGLLDIAYRTYDSPLGRLLLARTPVGLLQVAYLDDEQELNRRLERLARRLSPRILASPRSLDDWSRELEEYFAGRRRTFGLDLDWRLVGPFGRRVLGAAAAIPFGAVATYTQIAAAAGSPKGARAAGNALGANPLPIVVPCHRVVRSGGGLGGYTGGLGRKERLLAIEHAPEN